MNTIQVTDKFKIYCTNEIEKWRAETFWTKEPETIEWIKYFIEPVTFFDVGANIGLYSLYVASLYSNARIIAFEPEWNNYKRLRENIELNGFFNIIPIHAAVSNGEEYVELNIDNVKNIGDSGSQIAETSLSIAHTAIRFLNYKTIPVESFSLREISRRTRIIPKYIKIDIDGLEHFVIWGIDFQNKEIQSVLVEINKWGENIKAEMVNNYFTYEKEPLNYIENHSRVRRAKEGIMAENVIFTRK